MSAPLNLARQPFRNQRLPTLVLASVSIALVLTTVWHGLVARDLAPGRVRDVASEVVALEKELDDLRAEAAELRKLAAPPESLKEWAAVKQLVDRRMFSWTGLFAALEEALPPGVKLVSVSPNEARGATELDLRAIGRSNEDALALMAALQEHPEFEGAFLEGWNEGRDGFDIHCTVRYAARPRTAAARNAEPAGAATPAESDAESGE